MKRRSVAWVGLYPSHYVRAFHLRIEQEYPDLVTFAYLHPSAAHARERGYESGNLPRSAIVIPDAGVVSQSRRLLELLRQTRPSLVVVAGYRPLPLALAGLWGQLRGISVCHWSDTNWTTHMKRGTVRRSLTRWILKRYLAGMRKLLFVGSQSRAFYAWCLGSGLHGDKCLRLPYPHLHASFQGCGDRRSEVRKEMGWTGTFVVLYLGRLESCKGVDLLIRAMNLCDGRHSVPLRLAIAGEGRERDNLQKLVRDLRLEKKVEFLGGIRSDRIPGLFAAADLFVLPSRAEPWGLVVNEALSAGVPVVAPYWVGAASDLIIHDVTGWVLSSNEPVDLAAAIERLAGEPERLREMGQAGRLVVEQGGWTLEGALRGWQELLAATDVTA